MTMMKKVVYGALLLLLIGISGIVYTLRLTGVNELHSAWSKQIDPHEPIRTVTIHSPDADVIVKPSEQDAVTADLQVSKKSRGKLYKVDVSDDDGQLRVEVIRRDPYVFNIGVLFFRERIEIRLPRKMYEAIDISTSLADIKLEDVASERTVVHAKTGDIRITGDNPAGDYTLETSTGDVNVGYRRDSVSVKVDFTSDKGNGNVDLSDFHVVERTDHRIIGQIGSGERMLRVTTESGGFRLYRVKGGE